jgi:thymidylate synthase
MELIVAMDLSKGIGRCGKLPWHLKEELRIFKRKTMGSTLIVGRKTADHLPPLPGRDIVTISSKTQSFHPSLVYLQNRIIVAGGASIYKQALKEDLVETIHLSIVKTIHPCDTFIDLKLDKWICSNAQFFADFNHYELSKKPRESCEHQYLKLLKDVMVNGSLRETRNSWTKSVFVRHLSFNMDDGFPLLTTKHMFFRGIVEELLFFLRGDTDTKKLESKGIRIWAGNTSRKFLDSLGKKSRSEGVMGPMYGYIWRFFGASYNEDTASPEECGIDQLKHIVYELRNNKTSRRLLMTTFNPSQVEEGVLWPCHSIVLQFYVSNGKLDVFCYNRSSDAFLGLPFNIASTSLLLHIIASITDLKPGHVHLSLGDVHIYKDHFKAVEEQLSILRIPFKLPTLKIENLHCLEDLDTLSMKNFKIQDYQHYSKITAPMIE